VSDASGRVAELLVSDGDMVEFGQPLILLDPLDAE
jgi:biotin carboxyl carrier protein